MDIELHALRRIAKSVEETKLPAVTMARMMKMKKENPIAMVLPPDFIENLKDQGRWAVMICTAPCTIKTTAKLLSRFSSSHHCF